MPTENSKLKEQAFFFTKFARYYEIENYLYTLQKKFPKRVRVERIGRTIQNRDILMIVISKNIKKKRNAVLIDSGIHAREWLANSSALYLINYLIKNPRLTKVMDFYIIPCLNPDGYEYTHTRNRLWRKNRNTNGETCERKMGVDLNRNFPFLYGTVPGSSNDLESFEYRGRRALSEPESRALASVMTDNSSFIKLYISLHCYGNFLLFPWGFTKELTVDCQDLCDCAHKGADAIYETSCHKRKFKVGSTANVLYYSSGCSMDYARGEHKIKFSYTIELQKCGKSGFTPSTRRIIQIGKEVVECIKAMVKYVEKYYNLKPTV